MPKYDRQLILRFLTGDPDDDVVRKAGQALNQKARNSGLKSHCFSVPIFKLGSTPENDRRDGEMQEQLGKLTERSRIYLIGHGEWREQRLGDWPPDNVAALLGLGGMKNGVPLISIVGCSLGADRDAAENLRISNSTNSFAGRFHYLLGRHFHCYAVVYARIWDASVSYLGHNEALLPDDNPYKGRKYVEPVGGRWTSKLTMSKLRFFWEGNTQKREWAY